MNPDRFSANPLPPINALLSFFKFDTESGTPHTPADVFIGRGSPTTFQPAGLPVPTWCVVVNPNGFDDPEAPFEEDDLNEFFEAYNNDASLTLLSEANLDAVKTALWQQALDDAGDHAATMNGGTYAIWDLGDGRLVVGGFDNGGSDTALEHARTAVQSCGAVMVSFVDAHFQPDYFVLPENEEDADEVELVRLVQQSPAIQNSQTQRFTL